MNEQRTIITLAVTGSIGDRSKHPSLPVTPEEIAKSALEAFSAKWENKNPSSGHSPLSPR